MRIQNSMDVIYRGLGERSGPNNASVVDQDVNLAECAKRHLYERGATVRRGNTVRRSNSLAALRTNFINCGSREFVIPTLPSFITSDVVDDDRSTPRREAQGIGPPETAARAGHNSNLTAEVQLCSHGSPLKAMLGYHKKQTALNTRTISCGRLPSEQSHLRLSPFANVIKTPRRSARMLGTLLDC
jgi:hypothetical protein